VTAFGESLNRYSYVRNDPVNLTDPDGRLFWPWNPGEGFFQQDPDPWDGGRTIKNPEQNVIGTNPKPNRSYHGWNQKNVEDQIVKLLNNKSCSSFIINDLFGKMYAAAHPDWSKEQVDSQATALFGKISMDLGIGDYSNLTPTIGYSAKKGQTKPGNPSP
jgi:hypothetical protein